MNTTFQRRLPQAIMVCLALATFPSITSAGHSWGAYHWARTANPFTLKLGDNLSTAWDPYLATASSDWTQSSVLDTSIVAGKTMPKRCRPSSGQVEVCNATYGSNGWLGIAQIWISGNHITQGITKLNDTYFNTAKYNKPGWKRLVMCQEVGHTFGLSHQDESFDNINLGSCMDYTSDPDGSIHTQLTNEHPDQHDFDQLQTIYTHTDSTSSVSSSTASGAAGNQMPLAMSETDFATPPQWGRLSRSFNNGRTELYERDFGGGHKVFTFVIWAEGEERGR